MTKSKTPITDKIQKILAIVEKLNLDAKLDTGYDTSSYVQNWKQAGKDFDSFFGVDKFKEKYGGDQTLEVFKSLSDPNMKSLDARLAYNMFSNIRNGKVDLLEVAKSSMNDSKNPYIWKSNLINKILLNENIAISSVTPTGKIKDNTFWRSNRSSAIFVRRVGFNGYYFANTSGGTYQNFLHMNNGTLPGPPIGAGSVLSSYAQKEFKKYVVEAVEHIRSFVKDEENIFVLNEIAEQPSLLSLPILLHDAIMLGILDAANTKLHKAYSSVTNKQPQGARILLPDPRNLDALQNQIQPFLSPGEVYLTDALKNDMAGKLQEILAHHGPYTDVFRADLEASLGIQKYNLHKALSSASTTLYFATSIAVNQLNQILGGTPDSRNEQESELYFGALGWNDKRVAQHHAALGKSLINETCPITILRAVKPNSSIPLRLESFIVDYSNKQHSFIPFKPKTASLDAEVHNYVQGRIPQDITNAEAIKTSYIDIFSTIPDKSSSIIGSDLGKTLGLKLLDTCYDGTTKDFKTGVLFAGISPLFWDEETVGSTILVCSDTDLTGTVELPYIIHDDKGARVEIGKKYACRNAAGLYFDLEEDETGIGRPKRLSPGSDIVQKRNEHVLKTYNFRPLSAVRDEILKELYSNAASSQQDLANIAKKYAWKMLKNIQHGYWTMNRQELEGGKLLAAFNPWVIKGATGRNVVLKRLRKDNTIDNLNTFRGRAFAEYEKGDDDAAE